MDEPSRNQEQEEIEREFASKHPHSNRRLSSDHSHRPHPPKREPKFSSIANFLNSDLNSMGPNESAMQAPPLCTELSPKTTESRSKRQSNLETQPVSKPTRKNTLVARTDHKSSGPYLIG